MLGQPRISAIVCTHQRYDALSHCLAALVTQSVASADREIIVVDNGVDPVAHAAFAWPDGVRVIVSKRAGLSAARNLGVRHSLGEFVAFIDDDAVAHPDWLDAILHAFATDLDGRVAAVGGRVVPIWEVAQPSWLDRWHEGYLSIVDLGDGRRPLHGNEWLAGTNLAFRRAALGAEAFSERLGRCPEALLGNEEIAVMTRLRAGGHTILYDPAIVVSHRVGAERLTQAWMHRRVAWQTVSDLLAPSTQTHPDSAAALWSQIAAYVGRLPPAWRGIAGMLRHTDDPDLFRAQSQAIAALLRLLLDSGVSGEASILDRASAAATGG
jgi:glycosyltransferase involved in cell wall biosynthesis